MGVAFAGPVVSGSLTTYFGQDDGPADGDDIGEPDITLRDRAPTPWTNHDDAKAAFAAALNVASSEEGFEGYADGTFLPLTINFGALGTADLSTGGLSGFVNEIITGTNGAGRYPAAGNFYLDVRSTLTVTFSASDITAIGFSAIDIGDFNAQMPITVNFVDLSSETYNPPHLQNASGQFPAAASVCFVGIIASKPIANVVIENTLGGFDVFAFDGFFVGQAEDAEPPDLPGVPTDCRHPLAMQPCPPSLCAIVVSATPVAYAAGTVAVLTVPSACGHPLTATACDPAGGLI